MFFCTRRLAESFHTIHVENEFFEKKQIKINRLLKLAWWKFKYQ